MTTVVHFLQQMKITLSSSKYWLIQERSVCVDSVFETSRSSPNKYSNKNIVRSLLSLRYLFFTPPSYFLSAPIHNMRRTLTGRRFRLISPSEIIFSSHSYAPLYGFYIFISCSNTHSSLICLRLLMMMMMKISVTRLGGFWKVLVNKFCFKISPKYFPIFLGYFEKHQILR